MVMDLRRYKLNSMWSLSANALLVQHIFSKQDITVMDLVVMGKQEIMETSVFMTLMEHHVGGANRQK